MCSGFCREVVAFLSAYISEEPAHRVDGLVWLGDRRAAYPTFATATGAPSYASLRKPAYGASHFQSLTKDM